MFDGMSERHIVTWNSLIAYFIEHRRSKEAAEMYRLMITNNVLPDEYTLSSVFKAFSDLSLLRRRHRGATDLLLVDDSLRVLKGFRYPNQVTWTSLLSGLAQNGREEMALIEFRKMMRGSVKPNSFTLSSALRGCSNLTMFEQGRQIFMYVGSGLIDLYGKTWMLRHGKVGFFDNLSEVAVISLSTMVYCYAQNGFGRKALALFERMINLGLYSLTM
ncbi:unnamed protein product [Arabidopsis halleri]